MATRDQKSQSTSNRDPDLPNRQDSLETQDTPAAFLDDTPAIGNGAQSQELPSELSPSERQQAMEALTFLNEVRNEVHSNVSSEIPKRIGKYKLIRSIGRGGFAEVFLAEDDELQRRVALKVPMFDSSQNEAACQRFEREARLAASLGHPQIVPVFEYGNLGAVRFIAFAWCDGPNLSQWIKKNGRVDQKTAAQIVKHLSDAVQHAHQRGIVHRDLKPSNVLVDTSVEIARQPVWKRLRITDFGLARNYETRDATLTQDGQLVGTPAYMSPEQARGESEIGATSDIHALGIILYELLTGKVPFGGSGHWAIIRAVELETPTPPRKLDSSISKELDAICQKCLCKSPADRYATSFELGEELDAYLENRPVRVRPPGALLRLKRWAANNQKIAATISFAIASLIIGLGVSLWQWNVANNESNRANNEAGRAIKESERVSANLTSTFQAIDTMLDGIDPENPSAVSDSQRKVLEVILKLQKEIVKDPAAEGFALSKLETLARMMRIHQYLGQYPQAQSLGEENFEFLSTLNFSDNDHAAPQELWRLTDEIYQVYLFAVYKSRRYDDAALAVTHFEALSKNAEHLLDPVENTLLRLRTLTQKGDILDKSSRHQQAFDIRQEASELVTDFLANSESLDQREKLLKQQIHCLNKLARSLYGRGRKDDSWKASVKAMELQHQFMAEFPDAEDGEKTLAFLKLDAARYSKSGGNLELSIQHHAEGINMLENELRKHPNDNACREKLAWAYSQCVFRMYNIRRSQPDLAISNEEALANLNKAIDLVEIGLLNSRLGCSKYLEAMNLKARLLVEMKQFKEAEPIAEQAGEFAERVGFSTGEREAQTHSVVRAYHYLAKSKVGLGDSLSIIKAAKDLRAILDSEDAKYGSDHDSTWKRIRHTSRLWILSVEPIHLTKLGRFDDATELIRRRKEIPFASGRFVNQRRYFSGANQYAEAISIFRESKAYSKAKYESAVDEMFDWLELALERKQLKKLTQLGGETWLLFRENQRFVSISEQLSRGEASHTN